MMMALNGGCLEGRGMLFVKAEAWLEGRKGEREKGEERVKGF
jgi:hypothetical protein